MVINAYCALFDLISCLELEIYCEVVPESADSIQNLCGAKTIDLSSRGLNELHTEVFTAGSRLFMSSESGNFCVK